jgi:hypothetical protein
MRAKRIQHLLMLVYITHYTGVRALSTTLCIFLWGQIRALTHGSYSWPLVRDPDHVGDLTNDSCEPEAATEKEYGSALISKIVVKDGLVVLDDTTCEGRNSTSAPCFYSR